MIEFDKCHCGCGSKTPLASRTNKIKRLVKGQPTRYLPGHCNRKPDRNYEPTHLPEITGFCQCGCGQPTTISPITNARRGLIKGKPYRFLAGHQSRFRDALIPPNPSGLCWCGCGELTKRATATHTKSGHIKGEYQKWIGNHHLAFHVLFPDCPDVPEGHHYCTGCKEFHLLSEFSLDSRGSGKPVRECKKIRLEKLKRWIEENPEEAAVCCRKRKLENVYGITLEQYDEMFNAQNGVCKICSNPETATLKGVIKKLAVDHSHKGDFKVRGLLCSKCNRLLGFANDSLARLFAAAAYKIENGEFD